MNSLLSFGVHNISFQCWICRMSQKLKLHNIRWRAGFFWCTLSKKDVVIVINTYYWGQTQSRKIELTIALWSYNAVCVDNMQTTAVQPHMHRQAAAAQAERVIFSSEGCRFDSRLLHVKVSLYKILIPKLLPMLIPISLVCECLCMSSAFVYSGSISNMSVKVMEREQSC